MQAVVMAGGAGSRLEPITCTTPKPMVPVANVPVISHVIRFLAQNGARRVHVTLYHLAGRVSGFIASQGVALDERTAARLSGHPRASPAPALEDAARPADDSAAPEVTDWRWPTDVSPWPVVVTCWRETSPLGTAGSVRSLRSLLSAEPVLVVSGDVLTDVGVASAVAFHKARRSLVTVVAKVVSDPKGLGVIAVSSGGRVTSFVEKPDRREGHAFLINTGTYLVQPEALDLVPAGVTFDFSRDLFPLMLATGLPLYAYVTRSYWADVGTPQAYLRANTDACMGVSPLKGVGQRVRPLGIVGPGSILGPGVRLSGGSVVGRGCRVGEGADLDGVVVWDETVVGARAVLRRCVIGSGCTIGPGSRVMAGTLVGDGSNIGEGAVVGPGARVWPRSGILARAAVQGDHDGR